MTRNTITRSMHDLGLAGWFGGTLANAIALNPAAAEADGQAATGAVANAGWDRWTPVNGGAIVMHLIGATGQLLANRSRISSQEGVGSMVVVKTGLTGVALGATAYSRVLGKRVSENTRVPLQSGTSPSAATPLAVAEAQKQLKVLQWAIPALTGALIVVSSFAGEQQRPNEVRKGVMSLLTPG